MAEWQNGYAADCKSVYLGSTPGSASKRCNAASGSTPDTFAEKQPDARVVKLVDTRDLKSLAGNSVPVQVRPRAPFILNKSKHQNAKPYSRIAYMHAKPV